MYTIQLSPLLQFSFYATQIGHLHATIRYKGTFIGNKQINNNIQSSTWSRSLPSRALAMAWAASTPTEFPSRRRARRHCSCSMSWTISSTATSGKHELRWRRQVPALWCTKKKRNAHGTVSRVVVLRSLSHLMLRCPASARGLESSAHHRQHGSGTERPPAARCQWRPWRLW